MNASRDRRAIELLDQAIELPDDQIADFLDRECCDDTALRRKIESLMTAMGRSGSFLSVPPVLRPITDITRRKAGDILAGRYHIVDVIGSGGMGEVYRAVDTRLSRDVAVKLLNSSNVRSDEMRDRFIREMKSVAALSDANVVTLFDVVTDDDVQFAVMELIEGKTLRQWITEGVDGQSAVKIARGVASGLHAAHALKIMHRDIKPENIVVMPNGHPKILDFGLARPQDLSRDQMLTISSVTPGTIPYMSPEQAQGKELSCATDIFSLGVVLFESLTGRNPFLGETAYETIRKVVEARPPALREINRNVPSDLEELILEMLSYEASARPAATSVAERLSEITDTMTTTLVSDQSFRSPSTQVAKPKNRRARIWQPSLIVLPFDTFGDDQTLVPIADGLVENLTTVLTRVPMLSLTSRSSSFSLKGQTPTAEEVRLRFGVDYMIEGSLQQFGGQLRSNVQLIQTDSGFHVWAQQFDCVHDSQSTHALLHAILARLEPQLMRAIFNDLRDESGELNGRQLLVRAMSVLSLKGWHSDSFSEVAELLRTSVELEPDFALSHAYLALIRGLGKRIGLVADPESAASEAIEHAELALDLDNMDSNVLGLAGCALSDVGQIDRAIPILKNAIDINRNNAQAYAALGAAYLYTEDWELAIENLRIGIQLSPSDGRLAVWYAMLANAYLQADEIDKAQEVAELGCQSDRKSYLPRIVLTTVHAIRGDTNQAIVALNDCLRVKPDLSREEIELLVGRKLALLIRKLRRKRDVQENA